MKGAENKYLRTMGRIFGPAVEKAMPVMLKVALGCVGVLFVAALVLIYSDKRFGDGWEHPEAVAYMFQRAAVVLMWLVLAALVVTVIWFVAYMAINTRTKIAQAAKWICESPRKGLMLYGNVGAGKTMLLNSLIRLFREVGYWHPKLFAATAIDLCQYFRKDETEGHYREAVKSEILMIDDLGCEPEVCMIYGVKHTPIQNLLYDRYRFQRTTVITSNLTDKELLERYGIRMKDRMDETFDFITFSNQSYRKQL